eukprot:m.71024 g.71024  ORF g.71024 m.71024 type:complete len:353 (-) comp20128_c0_seq1:74-1132(-)
MLDHTKQPRQQPLPLLVLLFLGLAVTILGSACPDDTIVAADEARFHCRCPQTRPVCKGSRCKVGKMQTTAGEDLIVAGFFPDCEDCACKSATHVLRESLIHPDIHKGLFGTGFEIVMFPTFPRSGNSWIRQLIMDASGIKCHSVFWSKTSRNDPRSNSQYLTSDPGRLHRDDEPVVVKTHEPLYNGTWVPHYARIMRSLRNPVDNLEGFWRYLQLCPFDGLRAKCSTQEPWDSWLKKFVPQFRDFHKYWDDKTSIKQISVRYEDLLVGDDNAVQLLASMMDFVGYTEHDAGRAFRMHASMGLEGQLGKGLKRYSMEQLLFVNKELSDFIERYGYRSMMDDFIARVKARDQQD